MCKACTSNYQHFLPQDRSPKNLILHGKHWYSNYRNYHEYFSKFIVDYVDSLFKTLEQALIEGNLETSRNELKEMTPPPISASFDKQSKEEAVKKHQTRKTMVTKEVLPTPLPGKNISIALFQLCFWLSEKMKHGKVTFLFLYFPIAPLKTNIYTETCFK